MKSQNDRKAKCKRHRWRVGSSSGALVDSKIIKTHLNLWCERCGKWTKAYYNPLGEIVASKMIKRKITKPKKIKSNLWKKW